MSSGRCVLARLVDQNDIILDNQGSEWSANYRKIDYERFFREYSILSEVDERRKRRELNKDLNHTFVIKYEAKLISGQKECLIKEVCPERLGYPLKNEYNVIFHPHTKEI